MENSSRLLTLLVIATISICPFTLFAQTFSTSMSETVNVTGVYAGTMLGTVTPPPPVFPPNNGVQLKSTEEGTDTVIFKGYAYPGSSVTLLKNGFIVNTLPTNSDGTFEIPLHNIKYGTYTFGLRAEDQNHLRSATLPYTVYIAPGVATIIDGVIMPPTITTDKLEVRKGDQILFSGKAIPGTEVALYLYSKNGVIKAVTADQNGSWSYSYDSTLLDLGVYTAKARSKFGSEFTQYSDAVSFTVSTSNKKRTSGNIVLSSNRCDLNNDNRVNLLDFSIMAFWYKRLGFPVKVDLNSDGRINLTDVSILAYCWTG